MNKKIRVAAILLTPLSVYAMERALEQPLDVTMEAITITSSEGTPIQVPHSYALLSPIIAAHFQEHKADKPLQIQASTATLNSTFHLIKLFEHIKNCNLKVQQSMRNMVLGSFIKNLSLDSLAAVLKTTIILDINELVQYIRLCIVDMLQTDLAFASRLFENGAILDVESHVQIRNTMLAKANRLINSSSLKAGAHSLLLIKIDQLTLAQLVLLILFNIHDPIKILEHPDYPRNFAFHISQEMLYYLCLVIFKDQNTINEGSLTKLFDPVKISKQQTLAGKATLISNDNQKFDLSLSALQLSETLKGITEDTGHLAIPLEIPGNLLSYLVVSLHKIDALKNGKKKFFEQTLRNALDPLFVGLSYANAIELLKAVNYLDVPLLVNYFTALISSQLQQNKNLSSISSLIELISNKKTFPIDLKVLIETKLKEINKELFTQIFNNPIKTFKGHMRRISSIALSQDGKYALTGSYDQTARYWNIITGNAIIFEGHTGKISAVAISKDGSYGLTGSLDQTARYWNLNTGKTIKELIGHSAAVTSVAISNNGRYALTGSMNNQACIWDLTQESTTLNPMYTFTVVSAVESVTFSNDSNYALIIVGSKIHYYNLNSKGAHKPEAIKPLLNTIADGTADTIDGTCALTGGGYAKACLWDLDKCSPVKKHDFEKFIASYVMSCKQKQYALIGTRGSYLLNLAGADGKQIDAPPEVIYSVALSACEQYAFTGSTDAVLRCWFISPDQLTLQELVLLIKSKQLPFAQIMESDYFKNVHNKLFLS